MLTAAQIVTKACAIAKAPGFTAQGGQDLNLVLNDLVLHRDLKINRYSGSISVTSGSTGPFNLPADYLRTYDLFYDIDGQRYFLRPVSTEQMDAEFHSAGVANYPYEYQTDLQPQAATPDTGIALIYIYPQTNSALTLTHRYMIRRADISTPASSSSIPWFPDADYLIHATAVRLMKLTDDARYDKYNTDAENMLRTHLIMEGDEQQVVKEVRLDPRRFRVHGRLRATKVQGY